MDHLIKRSRATEPAVVAPPSSTPPRSSTPQETPLKEVREQAKQRVKLGVELLNAAQTRINHQQTAFDQLVNEHQRLRDELQHEVARGLQTTDQQFALLDQRLTARLQKNEEKLQHDVVQGLQTTDERIAALDQRLAARLQAMEEKIDAMQQKWSATEERLASAVCQAQKLLSGARSLRKSVTVGQSGPKTQQPAPPAVTRERQKSSRPATPTASITTLSQETSRETTCHASDDSNPDSLRRHHSATAKKTTKPSAKTSSQSVQSGMIFGKALQEVRRQQQTATHNKTDEKNTAKP